MKKETISQRRRTRWKRPGEEKKVKVRARPLTKLVILVLLAAIGWQLYGLRSQVRRAQEEREQYAALVAEKAAGERRSGSRHHRGPHR